MRPNKLFWIILVGAVTSLNAQTADNAAPIVRSLTLEETIRQALEHNLDIMIARYDTRLSGYRVRAFNLASAYGAYDPVFEVSAVQNFRSRESTAFNPATGLSFPNTDNKEDLIGSSLSGVLPVGLSYQLNGDFNHRRGSQGGASFDRYDTDLGISLRQPLLKDFWIDGPRMRIQVARRDLKISEYNYRFLVMDLVRKVQQAYYELVAARDLVKAREKSLELARRLLSENKRKVEVGILAPLDEKQAEAEAAVAQSELLRAQNSAALAENALKNLISNDYASWHAAILEPAEKLLAVAESYNRGESWHNGLALRPDFNALKLELEKQGILVRFSHNQLFPALDLVGSYGRFGLDETRVGYNGSFGGTFEDIRDDRNPRYSAGVILSFPLSFRSERNNYQTAKANREVARLRLENLHQNILVQIDDAIKQAQSNYQRVDATRQARLFAEAAVEAEQKKLDNGRSTSFIVLQLQRDLSNAQSNEIRALADYNQSLSQLFFTEGTILEKARVNVEFK